MVMISNVSFTSKIDFVKKPKIYNVFGTAIFCYPPESSIRKLSDFHTWGIRTCSGGGLVDTQTGEAVGFHCLDCKANRESITNYIDRLFKEVKNPDSALLIGGKSFEDSPYSMENMNIFEERLTQRVPNVSVFKEHVLPYSEADIRYVLSPDTWFIHSMYKPLTDYREFDVLTLDELKNNYKKIHIADGDILMLQGQEIDKNLLKNISDNAK